MADDNTTSGDPGLNEDAGADPVAAQGLSEGDQPPADEPVSPVQTVGEISDSSEETLDNNTTPGYPGPDDNAGANHAGAQGQSELDQHPADVLVVAVQTVGEISDLAGEPLDNTTTPGDPDPDDSSGANHAGAQGQSEGDQHPADEPASAVQTAEEASDPAGEPLATPTPVPLPRHPYTPRMTVDVSEIPCLRYAINRMVRRFTYRRPETDCYRCMRWEIHEASHGRHGGSGYPWIYGGLSDDEDDDIEENEADMEFPAFWEDMESPAFWESADDSELTDDSELADDSSDELRNDED
ncbi:hypothetical protein PG985_009351 [Apiospora marii]|uniref:uncharacterized protein n=1 Tax=Apiospora marii TaxID=335849 RepID=UPI003131F0B0